MISALTYDDITAAANGLMLTTLGGFQEDGETVVLLGPHEPGFWDHVTGHADFVGDDPLDHWSDKTISALADELGATALFPFGGPPYHPFISWALNSGEAWQSPVGLIVHKHAGLMASYRGALRFSGGLDLPTPATSPCVTCVDKPCLSACPVNALSPAGYDVPACKAHIETDTVCRAGCRVRLTCPISQSYGRAAAQTEFHMGAFVKE